MSTTFRGKRGFFSAPDWDIDTIFFVQIPLINEQLFCKYFVLLSVGNATKALLLMDVFILVLFLAPILTLQGTFNLLIPNLTWNKQAHNKVGKNTPLIFLFL